MAATNFTPISLYYSTTASAVPTSGNLVAGELALNTLDEKLYFKNSAGTVKLLASNAASTGTVSSVAATVPAFLSIAGSPITTSGTLAITLSGTALPVANGGTGLTTTPANGALDIGNGTGFTRATLTAGTGVTITNASGAITINATGTGGTVTSVAATVPSFLSITGSPITTSGTLAFSLSGTALPVTSGGTGLTSLTAGYIPFGAGTSAFGNSANLFWDNTNGRLGIGTTSPAAILTVNAGINAGFLSLTSSNTPTSSDQRLFGIGAGSVTDTTKARIQFYSSGAWTDGVSTPTYITLSTTPASSITAAERMRINSSGNVGIGNTISAWGSGITSLQIGNYTALTNNQGGYVWLSSNGFYDTAWKYLTTNRALYYAQDVSDGGHKWFNAASGTAGDAITFTQAMTLDASRRLMIDTTTIGIGASGFSLLNVGGAQASSFQSIKASGGEELILGVAAGAAFMGSYSNTALNFRSNNTNQMTLSTAGNLGIGVAPSAWNTNLKAIELKTVGNSIMSGGSSDMYVTSNAYFNASNSWIYANTAAASIYQLASGQHRWSVAASGTAGNAVGFTQAMTLDASGNLGVGTTSPGTRIDVTGAIRATNASDPLIAISTGVGSSFFTFANADTTLVFNSNATINLRNTNTTTNNFTAIDAYDASNNVVTRIANVVTDQTTHAGAIAFVTRNGGAFGERMRIDAAGNVLIGGTAVRGTTVGVGHLDLFNGTAPVGTLTNGVSLYSSSGDLKFMNAAGDAFDVGYRNIPQNAQTGNYTLTLADSGDHIYHAVGAGAATYTIPANGSVAFPIGTAVTFINMSTTAISIAITTDTMYLSSAGTTGTRTLAQYGSATAIKLTSTTWLISGSGLT